jgi:hypothetical protein
MALNQRGWMATKLQKMSAQNAQPLHDTVDAHDVEDGDRQDAESYERIRDGEGLVETVRGGDVAESQCGDRGPANVQSLAERAQRRLQGRYHWMNR